MRSGERPSAAARARITRRSMSVSRAQYTLRSTRVVLPSGVQPADVHVADGRIVSVTSPGLEPPRSDLHDAANLVIMPGVVDTHVHVNEPGRTDWEGFETASAAAAAGGVTTIVDMPLNSIPATTTLAAFAAKQASARGKLHVDAGFCGGVVPDNSTELARLWDAGVVGFKCFLVPSGVDEFPHVNESHLREAMPELARLGATLIVHAELPGPIEACAHDNVDSHSYRTFLDSRPRQAENQAVELMIRLSRETGCRVHIVHHSSADALTTLRSAKDSQTQISVETCPHYLFFAAEEIADGATEFKCCPPIREGENREQLWRALSDGTIDMIVSDHSPCPPEMKLPQERDFMKAWGGISSLQLRLPVMYTASVRRNFSINQL